jgi:hypothetical protein
MRPIRERWYLSDPATFFLAAILILLIALGILVVIARWSVSLLLIGLLVLPLWAYARRFIRTGDRG